MYYTVYWLATFFMCFWRNVFVISEDKINKFLVAIARYLNGWLTISDEMRLKYGCGE